MKWYKVEDYPVGSDEYVLVSQEYLGIRAKEGCIVAKLSEGLWNVCWNAIHRPLVSY